MAIDLSFLFAVGTALVAGGSAWGGSLTAIKGVKEEVKGVKDTQAEVKKDLQTHMAADGAIQLDLVGRLARIEGKLDQAVSK